MKIIITLAILSISIVSSADVAYNITDLGTLTGIDNRVWAYDINNNGQIVGTMETGGGTIRAFIWDKGVMTNLGSLSWNSSSGQAINDSGEVTGSYATETGEERAYLYDNGVMNDLGISKSGAYGINNSSQIVGHSNVNSSDHFNLAFVYSDGVRTNLGTLGGDMSVAYGINDKGQVTGGSNKTVGGNLSAFLYSDGVMTDLYTLGGFYSIGNAINDKGQVAGSSYTASGGRHAFLYSDGVMIDLGTLGGDRSAGRGINNSGHIVGSSGSNWDIPFVWKDGILTDLNTLIAADSGWILKNATDINDNGWIIGNGIAPGGYEHAFLLTPIPEPCTLLLLGVGGMLIRKR